MIRKAFIVCNLLAALALISSFVGAWIDPIDAWVFAFITLIFPYLATINMVFFLLWLLFKSKWCLLSLLVLLVASPWLIDWYAVQFTSNQASEKDIKISTYNVRLFNKYGWKTDKKTLSGMLAYMREEAPDIALFQEFYHVDDAPQYSALAPFLGTFKGYNYYFERQPTWNSSRPRFFGLAIFSRYPIVETGIISQGPKTGKAKDVFVDLLIDSDTIRVYNVHLESLGFNKTEYSFIENTGNPGRNDQLYTSKTVFNKFKGASQKRALQVNKLARHIENCPYPVILGGDFNDTRSSFTYQMLTKDLSDAFLEAGSGFGHTYFGKGIVPSMRIDFLLHSEHFETVSASAPSIKLSDHDPVVATFKFEQ